MDLSKIEPKALLSSTPIYLRRDGRIFLETQPVIMIKEKRALGKACLGLCGKSLDPMRNWKRVNVSVSHLANSNILGSTFLDILDIILS